MYQAAFKLIDPLFVIGRSNPEEPAYYKWILVSDEQPFLLIRISNIPYVMKTEMIMGCCCRSKSDCNG